MAHLFWGGADCVQLVERFGTPLYVLDETVIRARCAEVRKDFLDRWPKSSASYASKAFLTQAMARIVEDEGLGLDVVSLGELHTALSSGFPASRIEMHGNAKSEAELSAALDAGIGRIIVDGLMELEVLAELAARKGRRSEILLRVAPGIAPNTHAYITTGQEGSKFGLPLDGDLLPQAVRKALEAEWLELRGLHFHVGSQIFEPEAHVRSVVRVVSAMRRLKEDFGFCTRELNLGGGFGARSHPSEPHVPLSLFTDAMMQALVRDCAAGGLELPHVSIETGRWIVSEAGITLYRVETVKELPGVNYIGVDGGMADNPRPALYQAVYEAALANRVDVPLSREAKRMSVAGKCCETGDILIEDVRLPSPRRGDILALFNTGAYTFSMASNYNRLCRPAVVLVKGGEAEVIVERQTPDDLLRGDRIPQRLARKGANWERGP